MKVCRLCQQEKPAGSFYPHKGRPDGLQSRCKSCTTKQGFYVKEVKPDNYVFANLLGKATGTYKPDNVVPMRPGAQDHTNIPSVRESGRVNQYEGKNGSKRLRPQS